jgi:hypothetical protein
VEEEEEGVDVSVELKKWGDPALFRHLIEKGWLQGR